MCDQVADGDKLGLPRVLDVLLLNSRSRADIRLLHATILKAAQEVHIGKEVAIAQQIPSSYVALLKVYIHMYNSYFTYNSFSSLTIFFYFSCLFFFLLSICLYFFLYFFLSFYLIFIFLSYFLFPLL